MCQEVLLGGSPGICVCQSTVLSAPRAKSYANSTLMLASLYQCGCIASRRHLMSTALCPAVLLVSATDLLKRGMVCAQRVLEQ